MHNIYKKKGFGNTVNSFKFVDTNFHGLRDHLREYNTVGIAK